MARNIHEVLEEVSSTAPNLYYAGKDWYKTSRDTAEKATDTRGPAACGIVAALSPQTSWAQNIKNAKTLVETRNAPTLGSSVGKALRILDGEHPMDILGGRKVRAFYMNLNHPNIVDHVTVDRHAVNIALGGIVDGSQKALELSGNYDMVQNAYIAVSELWEGGNSLNPNQVQAATWVAWRTIHAPGWAENDGEINV